MANSSFSISLFLFVQLVCFSFQSDDIVLQPTKTGGSEVAFILINGADISNAAYVPLCKAIQTASQLKLWIGLPEMPLDLPNPPAIDEGIPRILNLMYQQGMTTETIFLAGHSLGGALVQEFTLANASYIAGQVLMGSYVRRKYRVDYPVPTLTVGGEVDGLARATRIMESYWHSIYIDPNFNNATSNFPVVIIPGLSHMQFASGDPPLFVNEYDLKPEISYDEAHKAIGQVVADFLAVRATGDQNAFNSLAQQVNSTGVFVQPLIDAFTLEGYFNFYPPCYSVDSGVKCTLGSPWSEQALLWMAGLDTINYLEEDQIHPVWQIDPVHLPEIYNNCTSPDSSCTLNITTVSQPTYDSLSDMDTGFDYQSAYEIRVKFKSRQAIWEAAGVQNVDFNTTDTLSNCQYINQQAYNWALQNAGASTIARYTKLGQPYVIGEDFDVPPAGPFWIWTNLEYNSIDQNGQPVIQVDAPVLRTPVDYWIPDAAGMHYCKLLSPARVMEWIYVDGLRYYDSISNSTRTY